MALSADDTLVPSCQDASRMVGWNADVDVIAALSPGNLIVRTQINSMEERRKLGYSQYSYEVGMRTMRCLRKSDA
jgi:hypothetical protein